MYKITVYLEVENQEEFDAGMDAVKSIKYDHLVVVLNGEPIDFEYGTGICHCGEPMEARVHMYEPAVEVYESYLMHDVHEVIACREMGSVREQCQLADTPFLVRP